MLEGVGSLLHAMGWDIINAKSLPFTTDTELSKYAKDQGLFVITEDKGMAQLCEVMNIPHLLMFKPEQKAKIIDIEIKLPNFQFYKANIIPGPSKLCDQDQSVIIFLKDLTEIYKTQKFKSDFVANVSHELRTPLQSIKLGLETINKGHAENDFESQKKFMPIIIQQTERMESLVNDLLSSVSYTHLTLPTSDLV